jgi:histidinol-phosphatase
VRTPMMEAAAEVAGLAGRAALEWFGRGVEVEEKRDGSPVTVADRTAEVTAREWIESRFPDDGILGEEMGLTRPDARRRWILDPIDGTKSFVRGVPLWGTLIAVTERASDAQDDDPKPQLDRRVVRAPIQTLHAGERVIAGAAYFPAIDELVVAEVGQGCWWNGKQCRVSEVVELPRATVLATDCRFPERHERRDAWSELARFAGIVRTWGDAYGYLLVATGRAEVMVDDVLSAWDAAPFVPILEEAGGVLTDWRGERTPFGGDAIATNAALADCVREILVSAEARARDASK